MWNLQWSLELWFKGQTATSSQNALLFTEYYCVKNIYIYLVIIYNIYSKIMLWFLQEIIRTYNVGFFSLSTKSASYYLWSLGVLVVTNPKDLLAWPSCLQSASVTLMRWRWPLKIKAMLNLFFMSKTGLQQLHRLTLFTTDNTDKASEWHSALWSKFQSLFLMFIKNVYSLLIKCTRQEQWLMITFKQQHLLLSHTRPTTANRKN